MATMSMNIRMEAQVKKQAQMLFAAFGLDMTTAINMFLRQAIRERGIPFELRLDEFALETAVSDSLNRQNLYGPFDTAQEAVASMLED